VIVASPAVGRRGRVVGAGREASYLDADGFIVVLSLEPPALPNGAQVRRLPAVGEEVVVPAGEAWDPTLRITAAAPDLVAGAPALVADAPDDLVRAIATCDPSLAAAAGARLIGRGGGLTPEGDDLIAGAAAVVAASWADSATWLRALVGDDLRARTTALSATLLELAVRGMGPEPLQALLAGDPGARDRLVALGHSTGRAYLRGAAAALANV
jgi:hypothetical protein